jgi:hypothetical protein
MDEQMNKINIYNLKKHIPNSIFSKINNKQMIIYFIMGIIVLFIAKTTQQFSYVFIGICLMAIFIYYSQSISHAKYIFKINKKTEYLNELEIDKNSLLSRDDYLVELFYSAIFLKHKSQEDYTKLITYIEDFFVTYETLKQNKNNIFLRPTDLVQPFKLSKIQQSILINDIRDQLERIFKHIQTIIYKVPSNTRYLDSYYQFFQLLRSHLSRYYNRILSDLNFSDHTSQYQLIRTSEDKYGWLDW